MTDQEPDPQRQATGPDWGRPGGYVLRPSIITPEEAVAMIDEVLRRHGIEPSLTLLRSSWRRFGVGPQAIYCGVVLAEEGSAFLQVVAPVLQLPHDMDLNDLYRQMLMLNHFQTRSVRFSIDEGFVIIDLVRPILGLDPDEVDDAISAVVTHAGAAQAWLSRALPGKARPRQLPAEALPRVRLKPRELQAVNNFLANCPEASWRFISRLMERWEKAGFHFGMSAGSIQLKAPLGKSEYTMIAIASSLTAPEPRLIMGWEGLRRTGAFTDDAVAEYQKAIAFLTPLETTESSAHILVHDGIDLLIVSQLVAAVGTLVAGATEPVKHAPGEVTDGNVRATLEACDHTVQGIFRTLMDGWRGTDGTIRSTRPGRISLKLKGIHPDGAPGTSEFALATLSAPRRNQPAAVDLAWGLTRGDCAYLAHVPEAVQEYEEVCSSLPGFETRGAITRVVLGGSFTAEHASTLVGALLALKRAADAKR